MTEYPSINERIDVFKRIRDRSLGFSLSDPSKHSPYSKTRDLVYGLKAIGLTARPIRIRFRWSQFNLPWDVLQMSPMDVGTAWIARVDIPERPVKPDGSMATADLDPTFDRFLVHADLLRDRSAFGIPEWNGLSSTRACIQPSQVDTEADSQRFWDIANQGPSPILLAAFKTTGGEFYSRVNRLLARSRLQLVSQHLEEYHA